MRTSWLASLFFLGCAGAPTPRLPHALAEPIASSDPDDPPIVGRAPTEAEATALRRLMATAERLRELPFVRDVPARVLSSDAIAAMIDASMDGDEIVKARRVYQALGLLPPATDVRALMRGVMGEQVAGLYSTNHRAMVIRDDVLERVMAGQGGSNDMVVVHEYVHALQDQHFALRSDDDSRSSDASHAYISLVEGDATLAMLGTQLPAGATLEAVTLYPSRLRMLVRQGATSAMQSADSAALASAPAILRVPLVAHYFEGLVYTGFHHGLGGFRGVDARYAAMPETMEQVMHPELAHAAPRPIALPTLGSMAEQGFTQVDEDTLGELELGIALGEAEPDTTAAAGWDGDRVRVFVRGEGASEELAYAWIVRFDTAGELAEARTAFERRGAAVIAEGRVLGIHRGLTAPATAELAQAVASLAAEAATRGDVRAEPADPGAAAIAQFVSELPPEARDAQQRCWATHTPGLTQGDVTLVFQVPANGVPSDITVAQSHAVADGAALGALHLCLVAEVGRWRFPERRLREPIPVSFSFRLVP